MARVRTRRQFLREFGAMAAGVAAGTKVYSIIGTGLWTPPEEKVWVPMVGPDDNWEANPSLTTGGVFWEGKFVVRFDDEWVDWEPYFTTT